MMINYTYTVSGWRMYDGSLAQYESILMIFVHSLILSSLYLHDFSYTLFIYVPVHKLLTFLKCDLISTN